MPYGRFLTYYYAIKPLKAQEGLWDITSTSFPQMKKQGRDKLYRDLKKAAKSAIEQTKSAARTTEDIAKDLARKLSGG